MSAKLSLFSLDPNRLWKFARIAAAALVFWSGIAWLAARYLVAGSELQHADALVILSGSALYAERAQWAAELYHEGRAPRIILNNDNQRGGWSNADEENLFFYERALRELRRAEVPEEKIEILMQPVSNTYEEAESVRDYAVGRGLHSILFVTSPQHSRRALWTLRRVFRGTGIEIGLSPARSGPQSPSPFTWWLRRAAGASWPANISSSFTTGSTTAENSRRNDGVYRFIDYQ